MAIRVNCGACQTSLNVKDEYAGRMARCPRCRETIKIPATRSNLEDSDEQKQRPAIQTRQLSNSSTRQTMGEDSAPEKKPATASNDPNQLMREILGGFKGEFPRVTPTFSYRLAALVVAAVMITLPIVYIGLIALFGYALYWHAVENITMFSTPRGFRSGQIVVFAYFAPLIIGGILIVFMIKPLFARSPKRQREVEISFTEEPILHSFVQRLSQAVNAPNPSLIEVDCEVNAAAFYRNGWSGFLRNDLGLRIGLPLLSSLTTRQLAGVLSHEFGHFSQGAGMRLSCVISSVNHWFVRVIYERDEWDEWLTSLFDEENGWISVIVGITCLFVWLTRRVLWCLMMIGHIVSCALSRQMEYDADKYEARLAGSEVFESTTLRMVELELANMVTQQTIAANYERAGLPDNLPLCLSKIARKLPPEMNCIVDNMIEKDRTGWFATHPSSRDRIKAAHRQRASGIFHLERPAKVLLKDFNKIAQSATFLFYKKRLGKTSAREQLTPTATFISQIGFDAISSGNSPES